MATAAFKVWNAFGESALQEVSAESNSPAEQIFTLLPQTLASIGLLAVDRLIEIS